METRDVFFACILVRDSPLERTPDRIATVVECALRAGGDVLSFDVSILLVVFGMGGAGPDPSVARDRFVKDLTAEIGAHVSFVHGRRRSLVGSVGTDKRKSFTFLFEGYRDCLRELVEVPLGSSKQV